MSEERLEKHSAAETKESLWQRVAAWIAPAALVVFALLQIVRAETTDLTPWKGGGFGMFSTLDNPGSRTVRVFVETPEASRPVRFSQQARDVQMLANDPSRLRARRLARTVFGALRSPVKDATAMHIEIWRTRFDPQTRSLTANLWKQYEIPLQESKDD